MKYILTYAVMVAFLILTIGAPLKIRYVQPTIALKVKSIRVHGLIVANPLMKFPLMTPHCSMLLSAQRRRRYRCQTHQRSPILLPMSPLAVVIALKKLTRLQERLILTFKAQPLPLLHFKPTMTM